MGSTFPVRTISVSIDKRPREVYEFASRLENLGKWASGIGAEGERVGDEWVVTTPQGRATVRFVERNELGVLDHYVTIEGRPPVYAPLRVVANGGGSEVSFTLFRLPGVSDAELEEDAATVERDLRQLKALMESG